MRKTEHTLFFSEQGLEQPVQIACNKMHGNSSHDPDCQELRFGIEAIRQAIPGLKLPSVEEGLTDNGLVDMQPHSGSGVADIFVNAGSIDSAPDRYTGIAIGGPIDSLQSNRLLMDFVSALHCSVDKL